MLAVLTVTTNSDFVDLADGVLSLREAIFVANTYPGLDEIEFDFGHDGPETIVLTQGDLVISTSLAIRGPGAGLLTIDSSGSDPTPDVNDGRGSRVFTIDNGNTSLANVELHGLTLTGGDSTGSGGAILAMENLMVTHSVITGNSTRGGGFIFGGGGGIFSYPATKSNPNSLVIRDSTIEGNSIEDLARKEGGGIRKQYGSLIIDRTTIAGNHARHGGGISAADGNIKVLIRDSTISDNTSVAQGGGILLSTADASIAGSTISGNRAGGLGGGVFNKLFLTLQHCTIVGNVGGGEGGLYGSATVDHSIIAGNFAGTTPNDVFGVSASYSLIGAGGSISNSVGNLIGTSAAPINPLLGPLADNGGPTKTHALLPGSPAIDAGDGTVRGPLAYYGFEESLGASVAEDFVGANQGTYHGGPALEQPGILNDGGNGISFDGVDDYVAIPRAVANDFTYSLWVKTSAASSTPMALVGGDVAATTADYQFSIEAGRFKVRIGTVTLLPNELINDGQWHHLAVTRKSTSGAMRVYIDGTWRSATTTGTSGALAAASELRIGQLLNGQQSFIGQMDEFAVYDRALSDGEIGELATTGVMLFDQRGEPFGRIANWDTIGEPRADMGSYERWAIEEFDFVVDSLSDGADDNPAPGHRSLREAVALANLHPGVDTITFAPELTAGGPGRILLQYGEMAITESVVIDGPGADLITIDAQQLSRVFNITATEGDFEIDGLTLSHGKTTGNNVIGQTTYVYSGGAIRSMTAGTLTIDEARVMESGTTGTAAAGGGVFAVGPVVLNQSTVSGNTTAGEDSSGGGLASRGAVSATDSHFDNNRVTGLDEAGGGIWAVGNVSLTRSTVSGNQLPNAAPFYIPAPTAGAGGVFSQRTVTVVDSTIAGNRAARGKGGGIWASTINVTGSMIFDNAASTGGGVYGFSTVNVTSSTVSGNSAGTGGGIYGNGVTVLNSTISGNSATARGGGIQGRGVTVLFSTITDNRAEGNNGDGGGVHSMSSLTARGSIIAGNSADGPADDVLGQTSLFFTLLGENSGTTGSSSVEAPVGMPDAQGNLIGGPTNGVIDPKLGPLAYNGGPTLPDGSRIFTHALLPGSPAIDAGDPLAMAEMNGVPEFDQRGMPWGRVANGDDVPEARIDMGAVEWQANPLAGDYNFNGVVDAADYSVWRDTVGSTIDLRADGSSAATAGAPDGVVDEHDYAWWKANFGNVIAQGAGSLEQGGGAVGEGYELQATEEIGTAGRASSGTQTLAGELRLAGVGEAAENASDDLVVATLELGSGTVPAGPARRSSPAVGTSRGGRTVGIDAALVAWLVRRGGGGLDDGDAGVGVDDRSADDDGGTESVDEAFAVLGERV